MYLFLVSLLFLFCKGKDEENENQNSHDGSSLSIKGQFIISEDELKKENPNLNGVLDFACFSLLKPDADPFFTTLNEDGTFEVKNIPKEPLNCNLFNEDGLVTTLILKKKLKTPIELGQQSFQSDYWYESFFQISASVNLGSIPLNTAKSHSQLHTIISIDDLEQESQSAFDNFHPERSFVA